MDNNLHLQVFLCHSSNDKPAVKKLYNWLTNKGVDAWLDQKRLLAGQEWDMEIRKAVKNSNVIIVCLSKNSITKEGYVQKEIKMALDVADEKPEGTIFIIPVKLEECDIPERMKKFQAVDLFSYGGNKKIFTALQVRAKSLNVELNRKKKNQPNYHSLQEKLLSSGVFVKDDLAKDGVLEKLGAKFAIDDVIVDVGFAGFEGVDEDKLLIVAANQTYPQLPNYVYDSRMQISRPKLNKTKAYLENWFGPIIDKGNAATLHVGYSDNKVPDGRYDYLTTLAVLKSIPKLQQELLTGTLRLRELARRMDLVLVVITADNKLVLARRSEKVDNARGNWMASIGESIDPSIDLENGVPNPIKATRRCLNEHDELNLSASDAKNAHLKILGIATEWQYLYANLVVLVQLDITFRKVRERVSDGEHTHIEGLNFTAQNCLPLIRYGIYESGILPAPLVPASRVALLMSLMSRFGYDNIIDQI